MAGVELRGLPEGLGSLTEPNTPLKQIYRKVAPDHAALAIRLSMTIGDPHMAEVLISPMAHERFQESFEAALAIKMLLMICGFGDVMVPVGCSCPITEIETCEEQELRFVSIDLDRGPFRVRFGNDDPEIVLERAESGFESLLRLLYGSEGDRLRLALRAIEASRQVADLSFALPILWIAPEALFAKDSIEATFKMTAAWASYATDRGPERLKYRNRLAKLYGMRSKVVHGRSIDDKSIIDAYGETYIRIMATLWEILSDGELPSANKLLDDVFL